MLDIEFYESSREEFLVSKIFLLMAEFAVTKFNTSHYIKLTKDYIHSEYMKDIKLSTIANAIGIDRCYLSKLFKAQTKMTFQEFLISTRMKNANEFYHEIL